MSSLNSSCRLTGLTTLLSSSIFGTISGWIETSGLEVIFTGELISKDDFWVNFSFWGASDVDSETSWTGLCSFSTLVEASINYSK